MQVGEVAGEILVGFGVWEKFIGEIIFKINCDEFGDIIFLLVDILDR